MRIRKWTIEELKVAIKNSESWSGVFRKLGLSISGGAMESLRPVADENNFDYSHFLGRGWNKGKKHQGKCKRIPLTEILVEASTYATNKLRKRLIYEGLKTHKCERCGLEKWNEELIPLEVDHVNGNNKDHRIENLKLLCPNCHAQTPTWRGRNKKS